MGRKQKRQKLAKAAQKDYSLPSRPADEEPCGCDGKRGQCHHRRWPRFMLGLNTSRGNGASFISYECWQIEQAPPDHEEPRPRRRRQPEEHGYRPHVYPTMVAGCEGVLPDGAVCGGMRLRGEPLCWDCQKREVTPAPQPSLAVAALERMHNQGVRLPDKLSYQDRIMPEGERALLAEIVRQSRHAKQ